MKYLFKIVTIHFFLTLLCSNINGQDTFFDDFDPVSYNGSDGSQNWSTNWIETDNNNPVNGRIRITPNNGSRLRFEDLTRNSQNIIRSLDLSPYAFATLSFNWESLNLDGGPNIDLRERLDIQISPDGGINYTTIGSFFGQNDTGFFEFDITPFISNNVRLRFINTSPWFFGDWEAGEFVLIDNFLVTTAQGEVVVASQNIDEDTGTITVTTTYNGPLILGGFTVDYSTLDDTAFAASDFNFTNGTLNFLGLPGETQTFTIDIIDNNFVENIENFTVDLTTSNNNFLRLVDGTITINDDQGDTPVPVDVPLVLFERFNGYFDYTSTGGTFRNDATNTCSLAPTSSNQLTSEITANGVVDRAFLIWTHSGSNADDVVTFEGQEVRADLINRADFTAGRQFHSMLSDVTAIVDAIPNINNNTFDVSNLTIDNTGSHCLNNTTTGGWALFIFFNDPILPASSINFYHGFDGEFGSTTSYTLDGFFAIGSDDAKTTVLSWEGDDGLGTGELLSVTTSSGTNTLNGDGSNTGTVSNPYNSTIFDNSDTSIVNTSNTFGIDLDTYDISPFITLGDSSASTNVSVGNDFVVLNSVLLKVPSNLIIGNIFEDINYGGGPGRDRVTASGLNIQNATVELYREDPINSGNFISEDITTTDANGEFVFGGMANGNYQVRVVNSSVRSRRGGGISCTTCLPVQTFKTDYNSNSGVGTFFPVINLVGGNNPQLEDPPAGTILNTLSTANVSIQNEGIVGIDFGFNFNTIVNTNSNGQGSLEQFIINSNNLNEAGLNIQPHPNNPALDPAPGDDTSIFNIPITDTGFIGSGTNRFFDIFLDNGNLPEISSNNTKIDGRTQTAFTGDTNLGNITNSILTVGTSATTLTSYLLPEIQVRKNNTNGFSIQIAANNITVRNIAVSGNNNNYDGMRILSGSNVVVFENLIGVLATGVDPITNHRHGLVVSGDQISINSNYIAGVNNNGIRVNNVTSLSIQNNYLNANGIDRCDSAIDVIGGNSNVVIENNLIDNSGNFGIENINSTSMLINQNTVTNTSALSPTCSSQLGVRLFSNNGAIISGNIISNNGRAGIAIIRNTSSGNLISENSIFSNGVTEPSLGIDISDDGVTLNDLGDGDNGPNEQFNFPIIETASLRGNSLRLTGWARPNAIIEIFTSDIDSGNASIGDNVIGTGIIQDYGEGEIYLGTIIEGVNDNDNTISSYTDVDGNTDTTNRFDITLNLINSISINGTLTSTATNPLTNSTSEFSNTFIVKLGTVITNRRVTYRIKTN